MIKMMKKLFSRKSTKIEFNDNKVKLDDWTIERLNSAKVITLSELEEM